MISLIKIHRFFLDGLFEVKIYLNELSFHGQFPDVNAFKDAIGEMMKIRQTAIKFGKEIHCFRKLTDAQVTHSMSFVQILNFLKKDEQRALMAWFDRHGQFGEEGQHHSSDDYLAHHDELVTDSALGEAAYCLLKGVDRRVASLCPSNFEPSSLAVNFHLNSGEIESASVINYVTPKLIEMELEEYVSIPSSWNGLFDYCRLRFTELEFSTNCFNRLHGHPFVVSAAHAIVERFSVLNEFKSCFDTNGQRTARGQYLYQEYFTGSKAWFSDSSETEKNHFKKEMTFDHPVDDATKIFCPWHGKVKTPQLRIHFSWPVVNENPLFIVYAGPKITKS